MTDQFEEFEDAPLYSDGCVMRGYHRTIAAATGETNREALDEIEDCMRHDIFHSTLDWQTRDELAVGAMLAVQVIAECNRVAA